MRFEDYAEEAQKTASTKFEMVPVPDKLVNGALGLCGETVELMKCIEGHCTNYAIKELGDVLWYVAECALGAGVELEEIDEWLRPSCLFTSREFLDLSARDMVCMAGEIADMVKKSSFQGHELEFEDLKRGLLIIARTAEEICETLKVSMEEVMQKNIEKLRKRYGESFDAEKSKHRAEGDI